MTKKINKDGPFLNWSRKSQNWSRNLVPEVPKHFRFRDFRDYPSVAPEKQASNSPQKNKALSPHEHTQPDKHQRDG
jgi:hypothetical protein